MCLRFDNDSFVARKAQMKIIKAVWVWLVLVGTSLVLADDMLVLYKAVELWSVLDAEFALIIGICTVVGISSALIVIALLSEVANYRSLNVLSFYLVAAICSMSVLLMNGVDLPKWAALALDGRNYSAAWCLFVALVNFFVKRYYPLRQNV